MEHTIDKNRKYCDENCYEVSTMSHKVTLMKTWDYPDIETFELKPFYSIQFNRKYNEPELDFKFG